MVSTEEKEMDSIINFNIFLGRATSNYESWKEYKKYERIWSVLPWNCNKEINLFYLSFHFNKTGKRCCERNSFGINYHDLPSICTNKLFLNI